MPSPLIVAVLRDRIVADFLKHAADRVGVNLVAAAEPADALARALARLPKAFIIGLDLGPAASTLIRTLRGDLALSPVPILMIGRPGEEPRAVSGLESGAVGFLKLPLDEEATSARLAELAQWNSRPEGERMVVAGPVAIDLQSRRLVRPRPSAPLSPCEFAVLRWLLAPAGRTYTRRQLLAAGRAAYPPVAEEWMVDANVQSLKRKLGAAGDRIEVVPGVGYRFAEPRAIFNAPSFSA